MSADYENILVIGGANMDITGFPSGPLLHGDSNPGKVSITPGGVGRNIAECLSGLGHKVSFLGIFSDNWLTGGLFEYCSRRGIEMTPSLKLPGSDPSVYLSILDGGGDMYVALNAMSIMDNLTPERLETRRHALDEADIIQIDTNLPEESLRWLLNIYGQKPIFCDTVSAAKVSRLKGSLRHIHTLKTNRLEAAALCGFPLESAKDYNKALGHLLREGVQNIYITAGAEGVYGSTAAGVHFHFIPQVVTSVNANGAGDAFSAGLITGLTDGLNPADTARYAMACASLNLSSTETIHPDFSREAVAHILKQTEEQ